MTAIARMVRGHRASHAVLRVLVVAVLLTPSASGAQVDLGEQAVMATIGSMDGPVIEAFGHVADAVLTRDGHVVVLDSQSGTVTWFDPANGERGWVARRGEGPGEVIRPHRATVDERGRLHVLDLGLSRLSTFEPAEGSARFTESRQLTDAVYDVCSMATSTPWSPGRRASWLAWTSEAARTWASGPRFTRVSVIDGLSTTTTLGSIRVPSPVTVSVDE